MAGSLALRRQLVTWLMVPLVALLAADTLVSYWMALSFAHRAYDHSLAEIAREIALHLTDGPEGASLAMPDATREVLLSDPVDQLFYEIVSEDGRHLAGDDLPAGRAALAARQQVFYDAAIAGRAVRVAQLRWDRAGGGPGAVIRVAETDGKRRTLMREILLSVILPQIILILIAAFLVAVGVTRGLSPLRRLQIAVASRSQYDRGPLLADVPAEVRPLIDAFNDLLARLDHLLTIQSRFVADAAHQMKTPVAGLQAQLELMLREDDPARIRQSASRLYTGLERLARLVSQLLSLARNEPEAVSTLKLDTVDLAQVAFETTSDWVPEALKRDIDLGFEGPSARVTVRGEALRLRELMENLLDNAIRYTRGGGRVTVRVAHSPAPSVSVSDDGPSIPPDERQRVFERFHRLLGNTSDGSGLGLAIVREIARIHGAEIHLADDLDGVGNTFTVTFPPDR